MPSTTAFFASRSSSAVSCTREPRFERVDRLHKAPRAPLARRVGNGPRKKRMRPKPRQYTLADLERARDRVAAAERRIDNDRTNNPTRGRAGLERAQLEQSVIESQLRVRGVLE